MEDINAFTWEVSLTSTCWVCVGVEHSDATASSAGVLMSQRDKVAPREESLSAAARLVRVC